MVDDWLKKQFPNGGAENAGVENAAVDCRGGKCRSNNIWKAIGKNFMMTRVSLVKRNFNAFLLVNSYLCIVRPVDLLSRFPTIFRYLSCARRHALIYLVTVTACVKSAFSI